ncbi:LPXTG cell wall anchor domain-containing protein [Phycicoccus endophyticus]|uniref:LPXTG cell wall anchor domain-containing protein n=1 Tax=Phycicoccus endophyticus TaxID=1690220 RepID=A0A7G9R3J4_9MICO|nr:LPXTG cell wall anchor domain-containing protein [Phycicoccus endophyticus]NHI19926.1 LPXTG cell wall anchor domain-containing protein [Phycicoccus endophyticus]QNN50169.1 LPXTG cell wall anchor domain-containing protein [Phycicoccus endophyticus]
MSAPAAWSLWQTHQRVTVTWALPPGVDPRTAPYPTWFPQTLAGGGDVCRWRQTDRYPRDAAAWITADGLLTLRPDGTAEDADAVGHTGRLIPPRHDCRAGELAQTGPSHVAWLGAGALLAIAAGITLINRRRSAP